MPTAWFCFLAAMVTVYVVLDGFDLGVGALHLLLGRTDAERDEATEAIGPDGYFHLGLFEILNWYGLLIGVFGLVVLCAHGAGFLALRGADDLAARARRWAPRLTWGSAALFVVLIGPTAAVRESMLTNL